MALFQKKAAPAATEPMDLDEVMKKYDRESNVRVWEGTPRLVVNLLLAAFSLFVIYVTLFTSWLEEIRLTSFMACIVFVGFLVFPAKKGTQTPNTMPWYDVLAMVLGTGAFQDCKKLSKVKLPYSLHTVGKDVFAGCTALKSISIPSRVTSIYESAIPEHTKITVKDKSEAAYVFITRPNLKVIK